MTNIAWAVPPIHQCRVRTSGCRMGAHHAAEHRSIAKMTGEIMVKPRCR